MLRLSPRSLMLALSVSLAAVFAAAPSVAADNTLKTLMKKMGATAAAGSAKDLAPIFEKVKGMAPAKDDAFADWAAISEKGQKAAEAGNLKDAKATCKECHDKYRTAYKAKYGSKAP